MQKVVIFGCGEQGKISYPKLAERFDVIAFSDNNKALWGKSIITEIGNEVPIVPPREIREKLANDNGVVIVCSINHFSEISRQLNELNIDRYMACRDGVLARYDNQNGLHYSDFYKASAITPIELHLSLSGFCNISCRYCPFHSEFSKWSVNKSFMSWNMIKEIANQAKNILTLEKLQVVGDGEPLLNSDWYDMINYILDRTTISKVLFYTNGMLLNRQNVDKLSRLHCKALTLETSIDGNSPEETEFWRKGSSYSTIKENLSYAYAVLDKQKTKLWIRGCNLVPLRMKNADWTQIIDYISGCGDYLRRDFPQANITFTYVSPSFENMPGTEILEYNNSNSLIVCMNVFNMISINHNGDILSCSCYQGNYDIIGNILSANIYNTWMNSPILNRAREAFSRGEAPDMCGKCVGATRISRLLVNQSR